jgi:hypothetical protein
LQGGAKLSDWRDPDAFGVARLESHQDQAVVDALLGGPLEFGKDWQIVAEAGLGARKSILASAVYRF